MGLLLDGLNKVRNFWGSAITNSEFGTGTAQETAEDIDIQVGIASSEMTASSTNTSQQVVMDTTLLSLPAVNGTASEMIWKRGTSELAVSRVTFDGIKKDNNTEILVQTRWFTKGRFG